MFEILLNEFTDEMNTTRKFLESISEDKFEFTPHEKSRKLGELVNHMLPISSWIPAIVENYREALMKSDVPKLFFYAEPGAFMPKPNSHFKVKPTSLCFSLPIRFSIY